MTESEIIDHLRAGKRVRFPHLSGNKFAALSNQYPASSENPRVVVAWKSRRGEMRSIPNAGDFEQAVVEA